MSTLRISLHLLTMKMKDMPRRLSLNLLTEIYKDPQSILNGVKNQEILVAEEVVEMQEGIVVVGMEEIEVEIEIEEVEIGIILHVIIVTDEVILPVIVKVEEGQDQEMVVVMTIEDHQEEVDHHVIDLEDQEVHQIDLDHKMIEDNHIEEIHKETDQTEEIDMIDMTEEIEEIQRAGEIETTEGIEEEMKEEEETPKTPEVEADRKEEKPLDQGQALKEVEVIAIAVESLQLEIDQKDLLIKDPMPLIKKRINNLDRDIKMVMMRRNLITNLFPEMVIKITTEMMRTNNMSQKQEMTPIQKMVMLIKRMQEIDKQVILSISKF